MLCITDTDTERLKHGIRARDTIMFRLDLGLRFRELRHRDRDKR